ncbi:hypothetical protein NXV53_22740 [Bacteroides faecis]|nr:hypothetical protein [Bacteroides faecis]MCS3327214.1 hypothetical protein [Bacteroides faecis]
MKKLLTYSPLLWIGMVALATGKVQSDVAGLFCKFSEIQLPGIQSVTMWTNAMKQESLT